MAGKMTGDRVDGIIARLRQTGGNAVATVNDAMEAEMTAVQQEAIARAPFDDGWLESSIKLSNDGRRNAWSVYVDEATPAPYKTVEMNDTLGSTHVVETPGRVVGDYVMMLHEGVYDLGPRSLEKGAPPFVGRKFLANAFNTRRDRMLRSLRAKLASALAKRGF